MHLEDKSPALAELTESQREQAMDRFRVLRSHTERGVPLPRAAQAAGVGLRPWSGGLLNTVLLAWLDSFGGPAKIAGDESCRQKQWN